MRSFTFYFNQQTFEKNRLAIKSGTDVSIDHVGFSGGEPFRSFAPGDELFIVGVRGERVYVAGRMIVGSKPLRHDEAARSTSRTDLIDRIDGQSLKSPGSITSRLWSCRHGLRRANPLNDHNPNFCKRCRITSDCNVA